MTTLHRRDFLRAAAMGAGLNLLPGSIRRALALPATSINGNITDVQHVVILMQENRSFDHYFGTMPGVRGFGDRFPIPLPGGENVLQQRNATRKLLPYHLDSTKGNALGVGGPHSWGDAHDAWDNGRMTHWPVAKTNVSMGYYLPADVPFHTALANAFTVCDNYYCSLHGGTNSNRIYHWTGANHGPQASSNGQRVAVINNDSWDTCAGTPLAHSLTWTTYPERLQTAGVSWKVYQQIPDNYTDNPLSGFKQYRDAYGRVNRGNLGSYSDVSAGPSVPYRPTMDLAASPDYEPLYKGIGNTETDYGNYLALFTNDALTDQLPQVSWIVGPAQYTEHSDYTPAQGAYFIQRILDALTANPTVWGKTVFFINYDENDCFFDHLPPPNPPTQLGGGRFAGKASMDVSLDYLNMPVADRGAGKAPPDGKPHGAGPRVPMFVVSPFSRGGWVNSQAFDHTSVLQFLEQRFGVAEPNITPWRRAAFGNLMSAFDFVNPNAETTTLLTSLPRQNLATAEAEYAQQATAGAVPIPPENAQTLPVQPTGTRPARPLGYVLDVASSIDAAQADRVSLQFANSGSIGAVFHVYDRLHLDRAPRRYTASAATALDDVWDTSADQGRYDLWVLGPNGFHRLLRGAAATAGLSAKLVLNAARNAARIELSNAGSQAVRVTLTANAYRSDGPWQRQLPANGSDALEFDLSASQGWYDFTVSAAGGFTRRFSGRLEAPANLLSDPAMGEAQNARMLPFIERREVAGNVFVTSEAHWLSGFSGYLPIAIAGTGSPQFSIDGGSFVTESPQVCAGQMLEVRHLSTHEVGGTTVTQLTVGTTLSTFRTVTTALDRVPNSFGFGTITGAAADADVESADITLSGYNAAADIRPGVGVAYSIDHGKSWSSAAGMLAVGQAIRVRMRSSAQHLGYRKGILKVGGVQGSFLLRTR